VELGVGSWELEVGREVARWRRRPFESSAEFFLVGVPYDDGQRYHIIARETGRRACRRTRQRAWMKQIPPETKEQETYV